MPNFIKQEITCPHCGATQTFRFVDHINTREDSRWKKKVLSGSIFDLHCTACGKDSRIGYPFLYHDPDRRLLLFLTDSKSRDSVLGMMTALSRRPAAVQEAAGYIFRAVQQPPDLAEKILIFESGMDDRVIELMKVTVYLSWAGNHDGKLPSHVLLTDPSALEFSILPTDGTTPMSCRFSRKDYEGCADQYTDFFPEELTDNLFVDQEWVSKLLTPGGVLQ